MSQASDLPLPLYTLFKKLHNFIREYPQFCMDVQIKGESDQIEAIYEKYDA